MCDGLAADTTKLGPEHNREAHHRVASTCPLATARSLADHTWSGEQMRYARC